MKDKKIQAGRSRDDLPELTDEALLTRFLNGDVRAFETLALRHQPRVYSVCLRMLGDTYEAEDATQEVFMAAHSKLAGFAGRSSVPTWLYRVAVNHCNDRLRARKPVSPAGDTEEYASGAGRAPMWTAETQSPERALASRETRSQIALALSALAPDFRAAVVLRDIEGLTHDEIVAITGAALGTVKSRINRGRRQLVELLADKSDDGAASKAAVGEPATGRATADKTTATTRTES